MQALHLELENQVFENFLLKNDPSLLIGLEQVLDLAGKLHSQTHVQVLPVERRETQESISVSYKKTESLLKTGGGAASDRGPRVNLSMKMDLVMREMDEIQIALETFAAKSHRRKCNLKAELEEIGVRQKELSDAKDAFEIQVVLEGMNRLTQKISEEKFVRFMEEWLKTAQATLEKMRLRTSTLKTSFIKYSHQLVLKEELGEKIDAVDFDQLRIENGHLSGTIEQKNSHLLELKQMNGIANLVLTNQRKYLQQQVLDLNKIKDKIKMKELKIIDLDLESNEVEKELQQANDQYEEIALVVSQYRAPEIMEYVKTKAKLSELKKHVRILERKNPIIEFALNSCIRHMKNLTGSKKVMLSWFKHIKNTDSDDDLSFLNMEQNATLDNQSN